MRMRYEEELQRLHDHICPRQVLGVRMGELAGELLGLALPQRGKRLLVFVETDGCFADGIMVATGCSMGHRTLRLVDQGKVAATFVDTRARPERALRIHPHPLARNRALAAYADRNPAAARSLWHAQLAAYQVMPADELLVVQDVELAVSTAALLSRPGTRVTCSVCGEEVINEREVVRDGRVLCRWCAGETYYRLPNHPCDEAHNAG
jgi:formylmethanofuran dehydrogenase subunit E